MCDETPWMFCMCCNRELQIKNGGAHAFFSHPEEPEPALNFQLNPSEPQHLFEEDVFRQFGGEDLETEGESYPKQWN